jgi:hypothetical protein
MIRMELDISAKNSYWKEKARRDFARAPVVQVRMHCSEA